jgi:hypothetical protein
MATTIDQIVKRPLMLDDIAVHAQRWSATLPPDDWDPELPRPLLNRQASGVFNLVSRFTRIDVHDAQLIVDTSKPSETLQEGTEIAVKSDDKCSAWPRRVLRYLYGCFGRRQNER